MPRTAIASGHSPSREEAIIGQSTEMRGEMVAWCNSPWGKEGENAHVNVWGKAEESLYVCVCVNSGELESVCVVVSKGYLLYRWDIIDHSTDSGDPSVSEVKVDRNRKSSTSLVIWYVKKLPSRVRVLLWPTNGSMTSQRQRILQSQLNRDPCYCLHLVNNHH